MRKKNVERLPRGIPLRSYDGARAWLARFAEENFNLLFLVGRPGIGKSQMAIQAVSGRRHVMIECHATKLAFYIKLYQHRDELVVIDDEVNFVKDSGKVALMNSLCQTNPVKTLRWDSTTGILGDLGIPAEFTTRSPVLVITNRLSNLNTHTAAMLDRGQPLSFQPSSAEIHREVANWFTDKEIHDFIGEWLSFIPGLSMRDYVKASQMKKAGMDWRKLLQMQWKCSRLALVAALRGDKSFATDEERVMAFVAQGYSKATYYRDLEKLRRYGVFNLAG
jgi:hypothetical protein